jgi:hypothetical protein
MLTRNHVEDSFLIRGMHEFGFAKLPFSFGGFFGQDVAFESSVHDQFAGSGPFKTLRSTAMSFHFRHGCPFPSITLVVPWEPVS